MTIEEIENTLANWNVNLTSRQKRYIHLKSFTNFVFHFKNLPNEALQEKVLTSLNEYVDEVTENSASFTTADSHELVTRHLNRLSDIYSSHLQFKAILDFRFVVLFSIIGDGILYLLLRNELTFYFPIVTFSLVTHYLTRKILFGRKRKLFGPFY